MVTAAVALTIVKVIMWIVAIGSAAYSISEYHRIKKMDFSPRYSPELDALTNTTSSRLPIPIIYSAEGIKIAGNNIYQDIPKGQTVKRFVGLGLGELTDIYDVRLNDIPIGQCSGCSYAAYRGTSIQTADARGEGKLGAMQGIAYLALTLQASDKVSGSPTVTYATKGKKVKVWDPATLQWKTEASSNPIWCIRDFITKEYGCGISEDLIDNEAMKEAATYCDELVVNWGEAAREVSLVVENTAHGAGGIPNRHGNSFKLDVESQISQINLWMIKGDDAGATRVEIWNDSGGQPGSKIATSNDISASDVPYMQWATYKYKFPDDQRPALSPNTTYYIFVKLDTPTSYSVGVRLQENYSKGSYWNDYGGTWNNWTNEDLYFYIFDISTQTKRYRLNMVIDETKPALDILREMCATCLGVPIWNGDKFKVKLEKEYTAVQSFTEDDIVVDSFVYEKLGEEDLVNQVAVEYIDPESNFSKMKALASNKIDQDDRLARGLKPVISEELSIWGITNWDQASRLAYYFLVDTRVNDWQCQFKVGIGGIIAEVMDIIKITHSLPGWEEKLFQVTRLELTEGYEILVSCKAYNSSVFCDRHGSTIQLADYSTLPNPFEPAGEVDNLQINEYGYKTKDGVHIANIDVSYSAPANTANLKYYLIQTSIDDGDYQTIITTNAISYRITNVVVGKKYKIKVKTVNKFDVVSDGVESDYLTIIGKDQPPQDLESFCVNQQGDSILFAWTPVIEPDIRGYEIREGINFSEGTLIITNLSGISYIYYNIQNGTFTYWIKAIDNSGNYSKDAISDQVNITDIPQRNIVFTRNEKDYYNGSFTNTSILSGNLQLNSVDKFDTYPTRRFNDDSTSRFNVPVVASGTYETQTIDIGKLITAKLSIDYQFKQIDYGRRFSDNPNAKFNDDPEMRFSENVNMTASKIELRTSENDVGWSDWQIFQAADYYSRYLKFRISLETSSSIFNIRELTFTIKIDVPDVDEFGNGVSVASGGQTITFGKEFLYEVGINITVISDTFKHPLITSQSLENFYVKLLDINGADVAGTVNWHAHGY